MRNYKKLLSLGALTLALGATTLSVSAATEFKTPAELIAGITAHTVESVTEERIETGKTYGTIASEAGKLDEYKSEILELRKAQLAQQVADGKMTQEEADAIIEKLEANQAICDGTGSAQIGRSMGAGFGSNGAGLGTCGANRGSGLGRGQGGGRGMGIGGMGLQDGSCYTSVN